MFRTSTLRRHARLFSDMAEANGVDLEEAVLRAKLDPDEIADGVLRCTSCENPDGCEAHLQSSASLDAPPSYCRNAEMLAALKGRG